VALREPERDGRAHHQHAGAAEEQEGVGVAPPGLEEAQRTGERQHVEAEVVVPDPATLAREAEERRLGGHLPGGHRAQQRAEAHEGQGEDVERPLTPAPGGEGVEAGVDLRRESYFSVALEDGVHVLALVLAAGRPAIGEERRRLGLEREHRVDLVLGQLTARPGARPVQDAARQGATLDGSPLRCRGVGATEER